MKPTLTLTDYQAAAQASGLDVPAIRAVTDVEALGGGFLPDDRPKLLFERHIMYRQLTAALGISNAVPIALKNPDIVNRSPGGYAGGAAEWDRMARAIAIDRSSALQSASWGMFQLMGFHWQRLGFPNVQAFVNAMYESEAAQLAAFVRFIQLDSVMHRALQMHDWATFARRYNGPKFSQNRYDVKLARAFAARNALPG